MTEYLIKRFVKNYGETEKREVREAYGVLAGLMGIALNAVLIAIKLPIGLLTGSIAIISDAFNNLSDMGSSIVAVVSAKMAARPRDTEHPFGHGRIEYISALIIAFIIMMVGFELLKSSFEKIIYPQSVTANAAMLIILALSAFIKLYMYFANRKIGKTIDSGVQLATARDSLNDFITTLSVAAATLIAVLAGDKFPVDGVMGVIISILVLYSGFGIARETVNTLLGRRPGEDVVLAIRDMLLGSAYITGLHDLIIHDYGPGSTFASAHAEVASDADIMKVHEEIDAIERRVHDQLGIEITLHMDPLVTNDARLNHIRGDVISAVDSVDPRMSIHDFRMTDGDGNINLIFDLVMPVDAKQAEREDKLSEVRKKLRETDARYNAVIHVDEDYAKIL